MQALVVQPAHLTIERLEGLKVVGKEALAVEKLLPFNEACLVENVHDSSFKERTLPQRRKGAKRCRVSKDFLCAFAPLREKSDELCDGPVLPRSSAPVLWPAEPSCCIGNPQTAEIAV